MGHSTDSLCRFGMILFLFIASSGWAFPTNTHFARSATNRQLSSSLTLASSSSSSDKINGFSWTVPKGVSFGSLDKLQLEQTSTIFDNKNSLCTISTRAIGLNFADIFCVLGLYAAANQVRGGNTDFPFTPGLEYSGIVVNDPTGTYEKGQRVLGFSRFGSYADIVQVPPYFTYPLPDQWSFRQGASFLVQALTAWHGLVEVGGMPSNVHRKNADGEDSSYTVLIHSAAGGVGLWASEIAARRGATVIGVVGSYDKQKTFEDRILQFSPNSKTLVRGDEQSFGRRLAEALCTVHGLSLPDLPTKSPLEYLREGGHGVDMVMESLGGHYFTESFESLNRGGALVTFGSTSYVSPGLSLNKIRLIWRYLTRPKIDPGTLTARNIRLAGFNLIFLTDMPDKLREELKACIFCLGGYDDTNDDSLKVLENKDSIIPLDPVTPPVIGESFDFQKETIAAMECLKGGGTVGKVVLDNVENPIS